jgi:alkylresorcinol/alkylpyrone synthase
MNAPLPRVDSAPRILASSVALPDHRYSQEELAALIRELVADVRPETPLERLFRRTGVTERYLALPADAYRQLHGFEARNRAWIEVALALGERAIVDALDDAGLHASDVDTIVTTTVTGLAVPSLDARLMNRLPFRRSLKRIPLFGLGCVGGAAGLARLADLLRGDQDGVGLLLAVELCSLTLQRDDASAANLISSGLFGDGAAAVVLGGAGHARRQRAQPAVLASESIFFDRTERAMGWDVVDTGFRVVLGPEVPDLVARHVPPALDAFLAMHGLCRDDIETWIAHPGGPKVMQALQHGLDLPPEALQASHDALARYGNISSASVLLLLDEHRKRAPRAGSYGVLMAMGPAFCAEVVLLRW